MARQARVCFNVASFDARPRDAVARESAAAEVVAYAFEQCRVGWVSDASPVGVDGVAVEERALDVGRVAMRVRVVAEGDVAMSRIAADVDGCARGLGAARHVTDQMAVLIL